MRQKHRSMKRVGLAFMAVIFASATALAFAPGKKQAPTAPPPAHYGPFSITGIGRAETVQTKSSSKSILRFDGPQLSAKSRRYDIAAPHIIITLVKVGTPARLRAQTAMATGGVVVAFRNLDTNSNTTITCDRADYAATNAAKELGKLHMTGNVRSVTRDPANGDTPLIQNWTSADVEFVDEDTTRFVGENGVVSGVIREPAPRKKAASGGRSQQ